MWWSGNTGVQLWLKRGFGFEQDSDKAKLPSILFRGKDKVGAALYDA